MKKKLQPSVPLIAVRKDRIQISLPSFKYHKIRQSVMLFVISYTVPEGHWTQSAEKQRKRKLKGPQCIHIHREEFLRNKDILTVASTKSTVGIIEIMVYYYRSVSVFFFSHTFKS